MPAGIAMRLAAAGSASEASPHDRDRALELLRRPCQALRLGSTASAGAGEATTATGAGSLSGLSLWNGSKSAKGSVTRRGNMQTNCLSVGS